MPADYLDNQIQHTEGQIKKNCCSSQCQVRPGFIQYTISVADDPSFVYGDPQNFNYFDFSIVQGSGASCPVSPPPSYDPMLSTQFAFTYDEFIDNIARYFIEWLGNVFPIGNNTVRRVGDDIVIELSTQDYNLEVDNQINFCDGEYTFLFCQYQFYDVPPSAQSTNVCDCPKGFWGGIIEWTPNLIAAIEAEFGLGNGDIRPITLLGGPLAANESLSDVTPIFVTSGSPTFVEDLASSIGRAMRAGNELGVTAPLTTSQSYFEDGVWHTKLCLPLDSFSNTLNWEGQNETQICAHPSINQMSVNLEDSSGGFFNVLFEGVDCGCNNCTEGKVCADYQWGFQWWPSNVHAKQGYEITGMRLFSCFDKVFDNPAIPNLVPNSTANHRTINGLAMHQVLLDNSTVNTDIEVHLKNTTDANTWRVHICTGLGNVFEYGTDDHWQYHSCCSNSQINSETAYAFEFDVPFPDRFETFPGIDPTYNATRKQIICCNTERQTCICPPGSVGNEVQLNLTDMYNALQPSKQFHIDFLNFVPCAIFSYGSNPSAVIDLGFSSINNVDEFAYRFVNALSQTIHTNPYFAQVNAWFFVEEQQQDQILTIKFCYTPFDNPGVCCGRGSGVQFDISYEENSGTNEFQATPLYAENECCLDEDTPTCGCPNGSYTGEILFTETKFEGEYVSDHALPPGNDPTTMTVNWHRPNGFLGMPGIGFIDHATSGEQIYLRILTETFINTYAGWLTVSNVETMTNPSNPAAPSYLLTYCTDPGDGQECDDNPEIDIFGDGSPAFDWQVRNAWRPAIFPASPNYDGDGQCCTALSQDPPPAQNPLFGIIEQELADCCDTVCPNPKGYISGKFNISQSDDTGGRYSVSRIRIQVNGSDILDEDTLFIYTDAYTPVEAAARFAKYINSNYYDNVFVVPNGPQVTVYVKNVDNLTCQGPNRTIVYKDNNNTIFFDEDTVNCCDSELDTQQINFTDQTLDITPTTISCCPDFNAGIQIVECCSDTPIDGVDLASCIDCYSAGRNLDPLNYFQNIQIDVDCIDADCFSFLFTDANGNTFYTECYEKVKCERVLTICADYPDEYEDCLNNVYGEADEVACQCEDVSFLTYQNCFNILADLTLEQITFEEDDNGRKTSRREYRLLSEPVPPFVVEQFENALNSRAANISENGATGPFFEYELEGTVTRNITGSNMWVIDVLLTRKDECTNNFGCVN